MYSGHFFISADPELIYIEARERPNKYGRHESTGEIQGEDHCTSFT